MSDPTISLLRVEDYRCAICGAPLPETKQEGTQLPLLQHPEGTCPEAGRWYRIPLVNAYRLMPEPPRTHTNSPIPAPQANPQIARPVPAEEPAALNAKEPVSKAKDSKATVEAKKDSKK